VIPMRPKRVRVREDPAPALPVLRCYFAALARSTSCDENTKDLSLFQLVTNAKHPLVDFGCASPYTSVFLLETTRTDLDVEVRAVWKARLPEAPFEPPEDSTRITLQCPYMYLRRSWTKLPAAPGVYDLMLDWRTIGGAWQRTIGVRFPVTFEEKT
jgi:hypothetical protein